MKRLVDLTLTGAKKLDFVAAGLTQVKAEVLKKKK
jgi:rare lipoprotein A (peptidoglycan hydrolase)